MLSCLVFNKDHKKDNLIDCFNLVFFKKLLFVYCAFYKNKNLVHTFPHISHKFYFALCCLCLHVYFSLPTQHKNSGNSFLNWVFVLFFLCLQMDLLVYKYECACLQLLWYVLCLLLSTCKYVNQITRTWSSENLIHFKKKRAINIAIKSEIEFQKFFFIL